MNPSSRRAITIGLFLTGMTSLAAEVVLNRLLSYVFGSSHQATATVLASYMAGLSAGAYVFGRRSRGLRRPLAVYGILEIVVALFYLAAPRLYTLLGSAGSLLGSRLDEHGIALILGRFTLSFAFVATPTFLIGATLPVVMAAPLWRDSLERQLPALYGANTVGAATGVVLAAYAWIPGLGLDGTLALCSLVNLAVGVMALIVSDRREIERPEHRAPAPEPRGDVTPGRIPESALLPLAFLQGALVFALEVVWTHLVGTTTGVTVFAFAAMLTAILLGIGIGSTVLPVLRRVTGLSAGGAFLAAELGLALSVMGSLFAWDRFPDVINWTLTLRPRWSFAERELVRVLFDLAVLLPATCCIGVALPSLAAAGDEIARDRSAPGHHVGRLFAANTAGAILGSLLCGFVLLGRFGSHAILIAAAGCAVMTGVVIVAAAPPLSRGWRATLATGAACVGVALAFPGWSIQRLTAGNHFYWDVWHDDPGGRELIHVGEDAQVGFVTVERSAQGLLTMRTNGKYESSDARGEFQEYLPLIGTLYARERGRVFLLGLGGGRSLAMLHELGYRRIDVAEYSPAVLEAARRHFAHMSGKALADAERVRVTVDDGRNHLRSSREQYDLVVVAITGAAYAGTGNLYNRDFFEEVRARLAPRGVLALWLQFHHLEQPVIRTVMTTLQQVLPHVHVYAWPQGGQGYLIAAREPLSIDRDALRAVPASPVVSVALSSAGYTEIEQLVGWSALTTDEELQDYVASGPRLRAFTDMNPAFEYEAARGLATQIFGLNLFPASRYRLPTFVPPLGPGLTAAFTGLRLEQAGQKEAAIAQFAQAAEILGDSLWLERGRRLAANH